MNVTFFSLVLTLGAVSAGSPALAGDCAASKCRTVVKCDRKAVTVVMPACPTPPAAPAPVPAVPAIAPIPAITVAAPVSAIAVTAPVPAIAIAAPRAALAPRVAVAVATPVACDPELLRARALARAGGGDCCSTKTKKKSGKSSTTQHHSGEVRYNEAVAEALEAAQQALSADQIRAITEGTRQAQEATAKALRELSVQGQCQEEALREMTVQGQCQEKALRKLSQEDHLSAQHQKELAVHAKALAEAGEHMRGLHSSDLLEAQAHAESELAALEGVHGESIRDKIRSTLGKLGRVYESGDDESDDEEEADDESSDDEESLADYYESGDDEDDDDQDRSSLEDRIQALEELARERGHDVDSDDSQSLEDRVSSLERLMRRTPGAYTLRSPLRLNAEDWNKFNAEDWKKLSKDWKRYKLGETEVLVAPDGSNWSSLFAPRAGKPGKAPKGVTPWVWKRSTEDGDDEDEGDDSDDEDEAPEAPEPPDAPAPGQAFAPFFHRRAPQASAETRREIESLMRDMRAQMDSMRSEMDRLREELVRASRRGAR